MKSDKLAAGNADDVNLLGDNTGTIKKKTQTLIIIFLSLF
jgi:hypothetical protein